MGDDFKMFSKCYKYSKGITKLYVRLFTAEIHLNVCSV